MLIYDLGIIDYEEAYSLQKLAAWQVQRGGEDMLFLLEHTPTVSLGRNKGSQKLPANFSPESLGATIVQSSRGGDVTCHFPGQLVVYPIIKLQRIKMGVRSFVFELEESIIRLLAGIGLETSRREGYPGVWVNTAGARPRKIASLGIAVKHSVSMHGLAINVARNMPLFEAIPPCGLSGIEASSIAGELGLEKISMQEIKSNFLQVFQDVFDCTVSISDIERVQNLQALYEKFECKTSS